MVYLKGITLTTIITLFMWEKYSPNVILLVSMLSLFLCGIMIAAIIAIKVAIQKTRTAALIYNSHANYLAILIQ